MKKLNCTLREWGKLALFVLVLGLVSCDNFDGSEDGLIYDFANFTVSIEVENAQGVDLLNPEQEGNITDNTIKALWKDKTYVRDANWPKAETRENMPHWWGLYTSESEGRYNLNFGEFSPTDSYRNATFTIDWGDGTTDTIGFDCYITWKKHDPTVHFATYLNGEKVEKLKIVK